MLNNRWGSENSALKSSELLITSPMTEGQLAWFFVGNYAIWDVDGVLTYPWGHKAGHRNSSGKFGDYISQDQRKD